LDLGLLEHRVPARPPPPDSSTSKTSRYSARFRLVLEMVDGERSDDGVEAAEHRERCDERGVSAHGDRRDRSGSGDRAEMRPALG
jgi:hypothetical protein